MYKHRSVKKINFLVVLRVKQYKTGRSVHVHATQVFAIPGPGRVKPAVWFRYDLSPITVKYTEKRKPFYSFITAVSSLEFPVVFV